MVGGGYYFRTKKAPAINFKTGDLIIFRRLFQYKIDMLICSPILGQAVGVDMEGVVNGEGVPTSLVQVADAHKNIFLFRQDPWAHPCFFPLPMCGLPSPVCSPQWPGGSLGGLAREGWATPWGTAWECFPWSLAWVKP
jgi:hypothetical protein